MISPISCAASIMRLSAGSSPASRIRSSPGAAEDQPQICPDSRAITSWRQAHDLAHLADRGAAAEMDHRRRQPRPLAAIAFVDPLDHLFAAFMFEIDVDIRRLAAFLAR